jgi:hypothetical protein
LASKRTWIYKRSLRRKPFATSQSPEKLVDGEGFLYLGRSHRPLIADTDDRHASFSVAGSFCPPLLLVTGTVH